MIPDLRVLRLSHLDTLRGTPRWVFLAIAGRMDHAGRCHPTVPTIAREAGVSIRGTRLALAKLTALQAVVIEDRRGGRARGSTYRIAPAWLTPDMHLQGGIAGRVSQPKPGRIGTDTRHDPSSIPASVAAEGEQEEDQEGVAALLRLRRAGAHTVGQGHSIIAEWTELIAQHGLPQVLDAVSQLPTEARWPSRTREQIRLISACPGLCERQVTADMARSALALEPEARHG
jgi:hypothetical protein